MEIFHIAKIILISTSFGTLFLSLVFLLSPELYSRIEDMVNSELIKSTAMTTVLEGRINFLNDWIIRNRAFFGILFIVLSIFNIRSLVVL